MMDEGKTDNGAAEKLRLFFTGENMPDEKDCHPSVFLAGIQDYLN